MPNTSSASGITPAWTFGDRLRKARRSVNMTSIQFANALGITPPALSQYETDRTMPRDIIAMARRVEAVTGVSALWLLDLTDQLHTDPPVAPSWRWRAEGLMMQGYEEARAQLMEMAARVFRRLFR